MSELLDAALDNARRGWRVIPLHDISRGVCSCRKGAECITPGKHPRLRDWPERASTDANLIGGWWKHWPDANVGILTGAESGLVVLDVDPRNGGSETLDALIVEHGPLPLTPMVETGGGGLHFYFAHPGGRVRGRELGPGLELKADGQFVVAPPSLTGETP
jgi:hypothetical protein